MSHKSTYQKIANWFFKLILGLIHLLGAIVCLYQGWKVLFTEDFTPASFLGIIFILFAPLIVLNYFKEWLGLYIGHFWEDLMDRIGSWVVWIFLGALSLMFLYITFVR